MAAGEEAEADPVGGAATLGGVTDPPTVRGCDAHALCRRFGRGADCEALEAWVGEDDAFTSLEDLEAACPPERIGLGAGAYAALFGPLFAEFE